MESAIAMFDSRTILCWLFDDYAPASRYVTSRALAKLLEALIGVCVYVYILTYIYTYMYVYILYIYDILCIYIYICAQQFVQSSIRLPSDRVFRRTANVWFLSHGVS